MNFYYAFVMMLFNNILNIITDYINCIKPKIYMLRNV